MITITLDLVHLIFPILPDPKKVSRRVINIGFGVGLEFGVVFVSTVVGFIINKI